VAGFIKDLFGFNKMNIGDLFTNAKLLGLENLDQIVNAFEEHIKQFGQHVAEWPGPYDPLNGTKYIIWERKAMIWLGRVSTGLEWLQRLSVLPPEQAARLKQRAMVIVTQSTAKIVMGNRF
jgi:hypothetical protein